MCELDLGDLLFDIAESYVAVIGVDDVQSWRPSALRLILQGYRQAMVRRTMEWGTGQRFR